jgi:integrase
LLDRWEAYLSHRGNTPEYVRRRRNHVQAVVTGIGASHPSDLTPGRVLQFLARQRRSPRFGSTTANHYIGSAKAFTRWLTVTERVERVDYLAPLSRESDETDRRHIRRVLSPADFDRLIVTTQRGPDRWKLTGPERALLYLLAATTGLRASELASLTPSSFRWDTKPPTVTVEAAYSKRRRRDTIPLHSGLVKALRVMIDGIPVRSHVWPDRKRTKVQGWSYNGARMLSQDLEDAGIPVKDERGHVYDFHSLRSQFIADMDAAGVSLSRMQKLARHSTPALTSHYTRQNVEQLGAEVEKLRRRSPR